LNLQNQITLKQEQKDKKVIDKMIIPIRCFSCGKPIGHLWEDFQERSKTEEKKKVLDDLGVERYCCRSIFMGHIDLIDTVMQFKKS
jgi:DNA-directed RNA polymerase subunit N